MKKRDDLRFLLLQIRNDDETMQEEYLEFVEYGKMHESQLDVLNTFRSCHFEPDAVEGYDGLFVGGSSDASVLNIEKYPFVTLCKNMLRYCYDKNIPVFASCFGFQLAVEEFGGKVICDPDNKEIGSFDIQLTEAAKTDKLLYDMPSSFPAIVGHKERAVSMPDNITTLGYTEKCPYHLFKFNDKDFYGFQFHPEVSNKDLASRIMRYRERYLENEAEIEATMESAKRPTPESNDLVAKFIDRVVLSEAKTESAA